MSSKKIFLKQGRGKTLFYRHPWVFSGAMDQERMPELEAGEIVEVCDSGGNFLATGYFNPLSMIAVRILSFDRDDVIGREFFVKRVREALAFREKYMDLSDTNAFRVVFAESDMLPGLVVDKYDDGLVLQVHTLGMDKLKGVVTEALVEVLKPRFVYERSDVSARKQDGLNDMPRGVLYGEYDGGLVEVKENGVKFMVDVAGGQKTGFFLDQRENRAAAAKYAGGKKVLNLFSYSGGFSVYALRGGASHVTSVDASAEATELCGKNMELNGFAPDMHTEVTADVFAFLDKAIAAGEKYDLVIVDPPAFVKSQKSVNNALRAYSRLNKMAMDVLAEKGTLISSSCSHYVSPEMFKSALFQAALHARRDLRVVETKAQPADHPVRLFFPEGEYLKFFVLGE